MTSPQTADPTAGSQLFLAFCPEERDGEFEKRLAGLGLFGFSKVNGVRGAGVTGQRFGTRAFPGAITLFAIVVEDDQAAELTSALEEMAKGCRQGQGMRVVALPVRSIV